MLYPELHDSNTSVFKYDPRRSGVQIISVRQTSKNSGLIPQPPPPEKMNEVFRRKVLDHVTSHSRAPLHPDNLSNESSGIVYSQQTVRRSCGRRKEEPPPKCKKYAQSEPSWKPAPSLSSSQVLLGKTELWRLSQKCPHKPQPPDSWRRNGRTCPGTVGCQFSLQHPFH